VISIKREQENKKETRKGGRGRVSILKKAGGRHGGKKNKKNERKRELYSTYLPNRTHFLGTTKIRPVPALILVDDSAFVDLDIVTID
jgi:hypothetical protein